MNRLRYITGAQRRAAAQPIQAARRRRQLHPFFFRMGPVPLTISSIVLIALMALLYLSQLSQAVNANQQIQDYQAKQALLQRENQDLVNMLAQEQSPAYIAQHARAMGMVPGDPSKVDVVVVPHLRPIPSHHQGVEP